MAGVWREYLGTANTGLIEFARRLRRRYRTGILSNSFVGAREREQAAYGFEDFVDEIVYSHEAGMSKPDPRVYALICARPDVRANETVFLDDKDLCVDGARKRPPRGPLPGQRPGHRRDREAAHRPLKVPTARSRKRKPRETASIHPAPHARQPGRRNVQEPPGRSQMWTTTQPISSVRTGSESGRPAPPTRSRSLSVARCGTRSTAVVLARVR
jgi:hypothetical protein